MLRTGERSPVLAPYMREIERVCSGGRFGRPGSSLRQVNGTLCVVTRDGDLLPLVPERNNLSTAS